MMFRYMRQYFVVRCAPHARAGIISYDLAGTFLYFTYSFVSIPTPGWIKAAHQHNVEVIAGPHLLTAGLLDATA